MDTQTMTVADLLYRTYSTYPADSYLMASLGENKTGRITHIAPLTRGVGLSPDNPLVLVAENRRENPGTDPMMLKHINDNTDLPLDVPAYVQGHDQQVYTITGFSLHPSGILIINTAVA